MDKSKRNNRSAGKKILRKPKGVDQNLLRKKPNSNSLKKQDCGRNKLNKGCSELLNKAIAVIGVDCLFPGANGAEEFWDVLIKKKNCISYPNSKRFNQSKISREYLAGFCDAKQLLMQDSAEETSNVPIRQRIIYGVTKKAISDAGLNISQLKDHRVGVFIGSEASLDDQFDEKIRDEQSLLVGKLMQQLNIHGPHAVIDAASASSSVALYHAARSLQIGDCDIAIVGGITWYSNFNSIDLGRSMGVLSKSGVCRPFDANSDGFMPAEGCAILILKLASKVKQSDKVYALLRKLYLSNISGENLTPTSFVKTLDQTYKGINISPTDIAYIETNTIGFVPFDLPEILALDVFYKTRLLSEQESCGLGSLEGNIGHIDAVSGLAKVIKMSLALHKKIMPGTANYKQVNSLFRLNSSLFHIVSDNEEWIATKKNMPRRAAINSLSASGSLMHIILEEHISCNNSSQKNQSCSSDESYDYNVPSQNIYFNGKNNIPELDCESVTDILNKLWREVLSVETINSGDDFFKLGGNSLHAASIMAKIYEKFHLLFPLSVVLTHSVFDDFSTKIYSHLSDRSQNLMLECEHKTPKNLLADVKLDFKLNNRDSRQYSDTNENIMLTGATGFLGIHLLKDLIASCTNSKIYCLIRAGTEEMAYQKIQTAINEHKVDLSDFRPRVNIILGDLGKNKLGMNDSDFKELAGLIDVIYHSGARVNFSEPYERLKAANVFGTHEIIRLSFYVRRKKLFYISTDGVFSTNGVEYERPICESDALNSTQGLDSGYAQSKWVAEKTVQLAISEGLPAIIFRPGNIAGNSITGVWNTNDAILRLIKGCIQLKAKPFTLAKIDFTPVDYVSRSVVYISKKSKNTEYIFHLINSDLVNFLDIFDKLKLYGYNQRLVSYSEWYNLLVSSFKNGSNNSLYTLMDYLQPYEFVDKLAQRFPEFDTTNALKSLENSDISIPSSEQLINNYFSYLVNSGFFD